MSRYALLDPDGVVDWTEDWSDWLDSGVNIASIVAGATVSATSWTVTMPES